MEITIEDPTSVDALWCLQSYFDELSDRFGGGFDPGLSNSASADEMTPPAGCFLIARLDDRPIGCGALKVTSGDVGEIKRMWVSHTHRGMGVARRLLEALERQAREIGLHTLRLETNETLKEAQALYTKQGYREVDPFNDEPYAHHWFEKVGLRNDDETGGDSKS